MFFNCKSLIKIDLSSFDIKSTTNIKNMFLNCDKLKEIKVNEDCFDKLNNENPLLKSIIEKNEINEINFFISDISPFICKIKAHNTIDSGFLFKYEINEKYFYFLISSSDIITENMITNEDSINIYYNNLLSIKKINLNKKERYIKNFKEIFFDVTIVEIIDKDDISDNCFLLPEINNLNNEILNEQIYIPSYKFYKLMKNSVGKIKALIEFGFIHTAKTEVHSSCSPIFLLSGNRIIGVNKKDNKDNKNNYACFIYPILFILKNDIIIKQLGKNEEKIEYIGLNFSNGDYYFGQSKNGLRNGKGILYNKYGDIIYEGNYFNDKFYNNALCKITDENNKLFGNGFLCKIPSLDKSKKLTVLIITNDNIIDKNA